MLNIEMNRDGGELVIRLEGRLDTVTAPELEEKMSGALDEVESLTMDFEKLEYISSAGLRILLTTQKQMNRQGKMKVIHANDVIREIFEVTGFVDILTIE